MQTRRSFLKTTAAGLAAVAAGPRAPGQEAVVPRPDPTPRFIFIRKGNGLFPSVLVPPSLSNVDRKMEEAKKAFETALDKHELPDWLRPLEKHRKNLTLLQGLSAKMCQMGHTAFQSPLGVCRSSERTSTITRATVDVELGRMFPSPFEHIEFTCSNNQTGVVRGMSAIGPRQPNYAFASPRAAYENLFFLGSDNRDKQAEYRMDNSLYAFLSKNLHETRSPGGSEPEAQKIGNYADSVEALRARNRRLETIAERIRKNTPTLSAAAMKDQYTTVEQHVAFVDLLLASLSAGLTNVVTFTIDDLGTEYRGLYDFPVHLHDVGHGKDQQGVPALEVRRKLRTHHMTMVERIVSGLKSRPEGAGTLFDHTVILYLPENGETHHSIGTEVPFVIMAGDRVKLNLGHRYIRLPNYDEPGHRTLGNWYTTVLNAYGNPIKHYGDLDVGLKIEQTGPIRPFLT
jgi:hypothetical protein